LKGDLRLPPGSYGDITGDKDDTLILSPGSYTVDSLKLSNGAKVTISGGGSIILHITGKNAGKDSENPLDLSGGSVTNASGNPSSLLIIYAGTKDIELTGQADSYGIVYAPNAAAKLSGKADWFGAMVVKTLDGAGNSAIHYDRSLGR
jgi:hypothetical protein